MSGYCRSFYLNCGIIVPIALLFSNIHPVYSYEETADINRDRHSNLDTAIAQTTDENRDRFLQPELEPLPEKPENNEPILNNPADTPDPSQEDPESEETLPETDSDLETETETETLIPVENVMVTGSTIFTPEKLNAIAKSIEGRSVSLEEIEEVVKQITRLYISQGYITSRAILPEQEIEDGNIEIRIIEGSIADIEIEGDEKVDNEYIRKRLELGTDTPVRVDRLEARLQLLKASSLIDDIEANLQPAQEEGQSNLVVDVDEGNLFVWGANLDNYETVSTGAERIGVTLGYLDITGNQDSLITAFNHSLAASSWSFNGNYNLPVNPKEGTLQLRTNIERNEIVGDEFESLDLEGDSELYEISFRQPIINNLQKEFALSAGFSFQESRDFLNGVRLRGTQRTNVLKFGQDYTMRDTKGVWAFRSQFNLGIDIFNATTEDVPNDGADAIFVSWLAQAQRLQRLSENNLLVIQSDLQLTPDNLLPSEQFVIGGIQSVRGYRQNARLADNGFRLSVEDRITVARRKDDDTPLVQLTPFTELGVVWNTSNDDPDDNFLASIGLGVLWQPISGLNVRLDYAPPLVDLEDIGDNIQEDGLYFSINYQN